MSTRNDKNHLIKHNQELSDLFVCLFCSLLRISQKPLCMLSINTDLCLQCLHWSKYFMHRTMPREETFEPWCVYSQRTRALIFATACVTSWKKNRRKWNHNRFACNWQFSVTKNVLQVCSLWLSGTEVNFGNRNRSVQRPVRLYLICIRGKLQWSPPNFTCFKAA